jgi:hypothetical protein
MKWASPVDQREAFAKVHSRQCWVLWPLAAMAFSVVIFEKQIEELGLLGQVFTAFVGLYAILSLTFGFLNYRCPRCKGLIYYKPTVCRRCEAQLKDPQ